MQPPCCIFSLLFAIYDNISVRSLPAVQEMIPAPSYMFDLLKSVPYRLIQLVISLEILLCIHAGGMQSLVCQQFLFQGIMDGSSVIGSSGKGIIVIPTAYSIR